MKWAEQLASFPTIRAAAAWALKKVLGQYEGGQRWSKDRSYLPGYVQDARFDADPSARLEILRKARYFERNNAIVNRMADLFEQFTVGANGLQFIPATSSEKFNQGVKESWGEWQKICDLTSLHSFATLQSLIARAVFVDGEIFILKTRGETGKPRIQLIEAHRVASPPDLWDRTNIIDGVEIDSRGRPIAYYVVDGVDGTTYSRKDAKDVNHVFEPSRPGQHRGLSMLYPVLNDLHDLDDLQLLEMKAAKDAAEISNVFYTENGELPTADTHRKQRFGQATQNTAGNEITEYRTQQIANRLGGRTVSVKLHEKLEQHRSERPSVAVRDYWDYLTSKVCTGAGIPKLLVLPFSIQGTVVRGEYDLAANFFRSRSANLASSLERVYQFYLEWAVGNDRRLMDKPGDWRAVTTRAPRAVNVDVGRNSSAMLAELEAGATSYDAIYSPLGLDAFEELRKRAKEEAYIDSLSAEFKLTPDRIRRSISESLKLQMQAENDARKEEDTVDV